MPEASKALGAEVTLERINANDLQARITAAISSGSGPDIIHVLKNWPHLYEKSLVDVSDVAEATGKAQGGLLPGDDRASAKSAAAGALSRTRSSGAQIAYRKSLFEGSRRQGVPEDVAAVPGVGTKLKAREPDARRPPVTPSGMRPCSGTAFMCGMGGIGGREATALDRRHVFGNSLAPTSSNSDFRYAILAPTIACGTARQLLPTLQSSVIAG